MNSRLYRVIFNKTLGQLVVVSEKATAQGKAGAHGGSEGLGQLADAQTHTSNRIAGVIHPAYAQWQSLRASILVGLGLAISVITPIGINQAQADIPTKIIADPSANKNQQPTVLNTASGLTQVNIQTPSTAGVSVNNYSQFDVGQKGAILNNSRTNANTQTAGWVEGNPWLAKGEARIILNQVNSTNPSQLAGYTEIAGKKAELVIANPAGITCSGCGFINASRTTITTGTPTLNNGSLTGFDVNSGTITVDGTGGDTRQSDYTQLIGQSVKLNANMYAKQLDVITGNNQVSYETDPSQTKVTAKTPTSPTNQPTGVALDISSLGGMYAGKIRLIGTDKGMGVTNAGSVNASETLTLDSQGNLSNSGSLIAIQAVHLNTPTQIDNSGTIASSQSDVSVNGSTLTNSGLISSSHGQANLAPTQSLQNSGTISAGQLVLTSPSLTNSGRLEQTGTGSLTLNSPSITNKDNAVIGQSLYPNAPVNTAPSTRNPPTTANNGNQVTSSPNSDPNTGTNPGTGSNTGTSDPTPVLPPVTANGSITAQNLTNQTNQSTQDKVAIITSNGPLLINSNQLTNQNQSSIVAQSLTTDNSKTDNQVTNTNSRIQLPGVNWTLANFNNQGGQLISSQGIRLNTGSVDNTGGLIATTSATPDTSTASDIQVTTGKLINQQGTIQAGTIQTSTGQTGAGQALTISSDSLNNQGGHLSASGDLTLNSGDSNNRQGSIASQHNATLTTGNLNNTDGHIQAAEDLNLHTQDLTNAGKAEIYGGHSLTVNATNIFNEGALQSSGATSIHSNTLQNTGRLAAGLNADGTLNSSAAPANLSVNTTGNLTSHGTHVATGNVSLQGNPSDLSGSSTTAGTIELQSAGDLSTQNASLTATDTLTLSTGGTLNNTEGKLAGNHLALTANRLDNTRGSISQTSTDDLSLNLPGGLINQQGKIASNSNNLSLTTSTLNNQGGQISHAGTGQLTLATQSLDNSQQGQVLSLGEQVWHVAGDVNNNTGMIQGKRFAITAGSLDNSSGSIAAVAPTNSSQAPTSGSTLAIAGNLNNSQGQIGNSNTANSPAGDLAITAQTLSNGAGKVISNGGQTWQVAQTLDNTGGQIQANRFVLSANQINNDTGSIIAVNSDPAVTTPATANQITGSLNNGTGTIAASNGSLTLASPTLNNAGEITSHDDLAVTSQNLNNSKLIYAGSNSHIDNQAGLTNSGRIAAQGDVSIHSGNVNQTSTGEFIAGILPDNSLATTPQNLTVTADQVLTNQGTTFATGTSQLTGSRLEISGSHNQAQNLSLTATSGDINHTGAQSQGDVSLSVTSPGKLTNDTGVLQSPQLNLHTASISNHSGTISQTGGADFSLTTGDIDNQGGNIGSGGNNFNLTAGNVTNTDGHILHGGSGTANVNLASLVNDNGVVASQGALNLNSAGAISKQSGTIQGNRLNLIAASLDNTGQVSTTQGDMALNIGVLTNQGNKAHIESAANLTSQGQSVSNTDNATLYAAGNMAVNAATVTNAATMASDKTLTVTADTIGNSGTLQSTHEGIALNTNQLTNASTGQIIAPVAITINGKTADTSNSASNNANIQNAGLISTQGNLTTNAGSLINDNGILSAHNMDIHSQSLSNQQGLISQAGTDGSLSITNQGLLDNQNTKPSPSDSGPPKTGIVASGNATLTTGSLNNQNGLIVGENTSVTVNGPDAVNNQTGIMAANQALTLNAAGLNNQQGQIQGATTQVTAGSANSGSIDNTAGLIQGNDVVVTTGTLTNAQTLQSGDSASLGVVAANNAAVNAQVINNQGGQLLAGNQLTAMVSHQLNNQADSTTNTAGGRIQAATVAITDPAATNRSLMVNNAGGSVTGNTVTLQAKGLNNSAGTLKGSTVGVDVVDNYTHQAGDTLTADDLTVTTQGTMTNQAKLAASNKLTVNATDIDNQQGGELVSGYVSDNSGTRLNASNNLSNHGLINGYNTYIQVGNTLDNLSHGRIYGDQVAIKAKTLNNTPDGTVNASPVIGARQRLDIGVTNLNNNPNPARAGVFNSDFNGQSQIISNGTLSIGGDLDTNHQAIGQANSVINKGATIESAGDMKIATHVLRNENADWLVAQEQVSNTHRNAYALTPDSQQYYDTPATVRKGNSKHGAKEAQIWGINPDGSETFLDEKWDYFTFDEVIKQDVVKHSDPARMVSGGNMLLLGQDLLNDKSQINAGNNAKILGDTLKDTNVVKDAQGNTLLDKQSLTGHKMLYIENGSYQYHHLKWNWSGTKHKNVYDDPVDYTPAPKLLDTYELAILNAPITTTPTALSNEQTTTVDKYNNAIGALKTLIATPLVATTHSGNTTTNSEPNTQDALKLLADFAKANNSNLNATEQKQLANLLVAAQAGKPVNQSVLNNLIDVLNNKISQVNPQEIRTQTNSVNLPNSSLYNIDPTAKNGYFVQTDPAFTNYRNWLSSDYMMKQLGLDPTNMHKRLGDGYAEQQQVLDQIRALNGNFAFGDYRDNDSLYKALMDNGIGIASKLQLRPGVALTAEQMSQLTTDIVWLVDETVTLPDGSIQTVLVPKVYVKSHIGDLKGNVSGIGSGGDVDVKLTNEFNNHSQVVAKNLIQIDAKKVINNGGGLIQGNYTYVTSGSDIDNTGMLSAQSGMALSAKGKIINQSDTYTTSSAAGKSSGTRTGLDHIGTIYVGTAQQGQLDEQGHPVLTLTMDADQGIQSNAALINNQGGSSRVRSSQGDVVFGTVKTGQQLNAIGDNNNYYKSSKSQDVGNVMVSNGDSLIQGENVIGTDATIHSGGNNITQAKNDIRFGVGREQQSIESATRTNSSGLLSHKTSQDNYSKNSDLALASNITGDSVIGVAGHDVTLIGTNAVGAHKLAYTAGHDITVGAAENRTSQSSSHDQNQSGLFSNGGMSVTLGNRKQANQQDSTQTYHLASNVGARDGNTTFTAGNHYQQDGSNTFAQMGDDTGKKGIVDSTRGVMVINAQSATIQNTTKTTDGHASQQQSTSGLTVGISNSLVDQARGINQLANAAKNTDSEQMRVMAGVAGIAKANSLIQGPNNLQDGIKSLGDGNLAGLGNTRLQVTVGRQSSQSNSQSHTEENEASNTDANVMIRNIHGQGKDSNFTMIGSNATITSDLYNNVDGSVIESVSEQHNSQNSTNRASGYAIGGYVNTAMSGGLTGSVNRSDGYGNGESVHNTNTHVTVGGTTHQNIGNNFVLDGAVDNGDTMTGHIGGGIKMSSRQDTATYSGKQNSRGFSTDIDIMGEGKGTNVSVNGGNQNVSADYRTVVEQTGMAYRKNSTVVEQASSNKGGYILTETPQDNTMDFKQGIVTQNIQNYSNYSGKGTSLEAGYSADSGKEPKLSGVGYGNQGDNQTSTTYGAVTTIGGKSDTTIATKDTLNKPLANTFNASQVNKELGAQVEISKAYGQEMPKVIGNYAAEKTKPYEDAQLKETVLNTLLQENTDPQKRQAIQDELQNVQVIKQNYQQDYDNWKDGGAYRVIAHTAAGALGSGSIQGAVFAGAVAAAAPKMNELESKFANKLIEQGMNPTVAQGLASGLSSAAIAGIGASANLNTSSTASAINMDANNRQLHPLEAKVIDLIGKQYAIDSGLGDSPEAITEAKKRLTRGALYNIDAGWKSSLDTFYENTPEKKDEDQKAYTYLREVASKAQSGLSWLIFDLELANGNKNAIPNFYTDAGDKSNFTANTKDFNNKKLFLNTAFNDEDTRNVYNNYANLRSDSNTTPSTIIENIEINNVGLGLGAIVGVNNYGINVKNTAIAAKDKISNLSTSDLTNLPTTIATNNLVTGAIVLGTAHQLMEKAKDPEGTYNQTKSNIVSTVDSWKDQAQSASNEQKLLWLQNNDFASSFNTGVKIGETGSEAVVTAATFVATDGVGAVAGRGLSAGGRILNEGAQATADALTPRPALATGAIGSDGATAIAGIPSGSGNISGAGVAGATLSVGSNTSDLASQLDYKVTTKEIDDNRSTIDINSNKRLKDDGTITSKRYETDYLKSTFYKNQGELYIDNMQVLNKGNNLGTELISQAIDTAGGSNVKLVRAELAYDNQAAFNNIYQASHDAISSVNSTPLGKSMSSLGFEVDTIQVPSTGFPKVTFKRK